MEKKTNFNNTLLSLLGLWPKKGMVLETGELFRSAWPCLHPVTHNHAGNQLQYLTQICEVAGILKRISAEFKDRIKEVASYLEPSGDIAPVARWQDNCIEIFTSSILKQRSGFS